MEHSHGFIHQRLNRAINILAIISLPLNYCGLGFIDLLGLFASDFAVNNKQHVSGLKIDSTA